MHLTDELLGTIFSDASDFCGREEVTHAIIYHHLRKAGFSSKQIAREKALSGTAIDIVLFGEDVTGDFSTTNKKPLMAIEVKGGAYRNRNSLKDEIDSFGFCTDMEKLKSEAHRHVECWFLCLDMPDLEQAVRTKKRELIAKNCMRLNISFAYYCQGEGYFYVSRLNHGLIPIPIKKSHKHNSNACLDFLFNRRHPKFRVLLRNCLSVNGHEANYTAILYSCLRDAGFNSRQISLETYFNFTKKRDGRPPDRPDLIVFNKDFDGKFNLFRGGDLHRPLDGHKLDHMQVLFEVKGGANMASKNDYSIIKSYLADVKKLKDFRDMSKSTRQDCSFKTVFFAVDTRDNGLSSHYLEKLIQECKKNGNGLIYLGRENIETISP